MLDSFIDTLMLNLFKMYYLPFAYLIADNYCIQDNGLGLFPLSMLYVYIVYFLALPLYFITIETVKPNNNYNRMIVPLILVLTPFFVPFIIAFGFCILTPCPQNSLL